MSITTNGDVSTEDAFAHRPRLLGLAYRMLGDMDAAEDVVQEAFLRWHRADRAAIRSAEAWLVTVVSRLAVDQLRRAATERAPYEGPWLPQPVATDGFASPSTAPAPDRDVELASDLSVAFLLLLERLAPEERAAFLLREVFGEEYAEIARILERSQPAVRQMVHRARLRVRAERPRVAAPAEEHERMFERFAAALAADHAGAMMALLAPDVALGTDGGGRTLAARRWIVGPDNVVRFFTGITRKGGAGVTHRMTRLNGVPAQLAFRNGELIAATTLDVRDGRVQSIYVVVNPHKLRRIAVGPENLA